MLLRGIEFSDGHDEDVPYGTRYPLPFGYDLLVYHRTDMRRDCHDSPHDYWRYAITPFTETVWANGNLHTLLVKAEWQHIPAQRCSKVGQPHWRLDPEFTEPQLVISTWGVRELPYTLPLRIRLAWIVFGWRSIVVLVKRGDAPKRRWGFMAANGAGFSWMPFTAYAQLNRIEMNADGL